MTCAVAGWWGGEVSTVSFRHLSLDRCDSRFQETDCLQSSAEKGGGHHPRVGELLQDSASWKSWSYYAAFLYKSSPRHLKSTEVPLCIHPSLQVMGGWGYPAPSKTRLHKRSPSMRKRCFRTVHCTNPTRPAVRRLCNVFLTEQLLKISSEVAVCARTVSMSCEINDIHVKR